MRGELGSDERAQEDGVGELRRLREREPDHGRDGAVAAPLAEERRLELRIGALERVVVPVETAARLGGRHQQTEEHRPEERVVLGRARACMSLREDRRRRLTSQLLEREESVLARAKHRLALLDERPHERTELVERGPGALDVLLEGERELGALLEVAAEHDERAEDEAAEQRIEMRCAYDHDSPYGSCARSPPSREAELDRATA